jgi:hypothetical protein
VLPDVGAEFLCFLRKLGPSLFAVCRGDQEADTHTNSNSRGKSHDAPNGAVVFLRTESLCRSCDAIRGSLESVLRRVTKIVNVVADSPTNTLSGTIRLVKYEKTGPECHLKKFLHSHSFPPLDRADAYAAVRDHLHDSPSSTYQVEHEGYDS